VLTNQSEDILGESDAKPNPNMPRSRGFPALSLKTRDFPALALATFPRLPTPLTFARLHAPATDPATKKLRS